MSEKPRRRKTRKPSPPDEPVGREEAATSPEAAAPAEAVPEATGPEAQEPSAEARRAQELEDRLRRAQAEFVNETRRIARLAEEERKYAVERLVVELLPVFDALHSAREGLGDADEGDPLRQGLDLVERELLQVLGRHGITRIEAEGQPFDPTRHEALLVVEDPDRAADSVARVIRPGFALHGRVVRAAHVAVVAAARPPPPAGEPQPAPEEASGETRGSEGD